MELAFNAGVKRVHYSFNPPGGFGAFGTLLQVPQDARDLVSIRRADLGLLEPKGAATA